MNNPEIELAEKTETKQKEEEQNMPKAIEISTREKNSNNYTEVTSEDSIPVPVPSGYVASPDEEERYVNGVTTEGTREHHGGFVIYERLASDAGKTDAEVQAIIEDDMDVAQRTRNQFVWVPIEDVTDMYHTSGNLIYGNTYTFSVSGYSKSTKNSREPVLVSYDTDNYQAKKSTSNYSEHYAMNEQLEGMKRAELLQEMREEFYEMIESIKTYGGFYIGRYETGNLSKNNAKVVRGQIGTTSKQNASSNNINWITWYGAYKKCKSLRGTNPIKTGLIWGIQWDETLKWLIDSGEKTYEEINNSKDWGNHYDNTASGHGSLRATGYSESWKANNIYDLAGNIWEWTMLTYNSDYRYYRGGYFKYGAASSGVSHGYFANPGYSGMDIGCRASLCVM